jgi:hypothetical protein
MNIVLTENEQKSVWDKMIQAEVRSYYFAALASHYTKEKQIITGISFFLSSGAAATLVAKLPSYIPIVLSIIAAILAAYSIAINLDKRVIALSKLHTQWAQLCSDYEHLWNHLNDEDAAQTYQELLDRGRKASESSLDLPYDEKTLNKWTDFVFARFHTA